MTNDNSKHRITVKKVLKIILNVLTYLFLAICIIALLLAVTGKKSYDGATNILGKQMRIVISDSMAKCDETDVSGYKIKDIPIKSMIFIDLVPDTQEEAEEWYSELEVGDVLTFRYVYITQETITHRITEITPKETGGYIIQLEGDNKASASSDTLVQTIDTSIEDSPNFVLGKVTAKSYPLGLLVSSLQTPVGIVLFIIVPCLIIAFFEIYKIINVLSAGKRQREQEEKRKRDEEFEQMKKQLELLQQQQQSMAQTQSSTPVGTQQVSADQTEEPKQTEE